MKKYIGLLLAFVMIASIVPSALANPQITLNCNVTCDGQNDVTKETGDIITVTYTLENTTDENASFPLLSHTDEIYYDPGFFQYVDGSASVTSGLNLSVSHQEWSWGARSIAFAGFEPSLKAYDSKQVIGTFKLKVIATEGSSTIYSQSMKVGSGNGDYAITTDDLVVRIGNAVVTPKYELSFVTNGGSAIAAVKKDEGTTVDLSNFNPVRAGYVLDGWYSDIALTNKVTSVLMDSDKTVYAKWSVKSTGGGGSTVSDYTISFETNGGIEMDDIDVNKNTTIDLSKYVPKKDGYTFTGWYSDKDLKNKIETVKMTKDITIYAGWTKDGAASPVTPDSAYIPGILNSDEHFAYIVGYDDGNVHPNADITRAEVAVIVFRLLKDDVRTSNLTNTNSFSDVPSEEWYNQAISTMAAMNVLKGYEGLFRPASPITRAEFAAIFARLADKSGNSSASFNDITGHWAEDEILKAASLGWVQGFDGYYRPDDAITRAEAMTIINRALCRLPEGEADLLSDMKVWSDNADTSMWYYTAVQEATNSHSFTRKSDGVHEKWTALSENPDWTKLEK